MRTVAIITVRNEAKYLSHCLTHLNNQGIETCVIDNDSTDESRDIIKAFIGRGVFSIQRLPYKGFFDLIAQTRQKFEISKSINADWFLHLDADEIMEAPDNIRLNEAFIKVNELGYDAVNFDEFVFIPTDEEENYVGRDYVAEMRYYYYFAPSSMRLVRAWKQSARSEMFVMSGGHRAVSETARIYPVNFTLRHYMALSANHARDKYSFERKYSDIEIKMGWHQSRSNFKSCMLTLPGVDRMQRLQSDGILSKHDPWSVHGLFESQILDHPKND
jgi:glycosyltransferase involved in cell wall biosynthesis